MSELFKVHEMMSISALPMGRSNPLTDMTTKKLFLRDFDQDGRIDKIVVREAHWLEFSKGIGRDKRSGAPLFAKDAKKVFGDDYKTMDSDVFINGAILVTDVGDFDGDGDTDMTVIRFSCSSREFPDIEMGQFCSGTLSMSYYLLENQSADKKKRARVKK